MSTDQSGSGAFLPRLRSENGASDDRPDSAKHEPDYRTLPLSVRLDETIAIVDADPVPDPAAGRNVELSPSEWCTTR